jgi:hypothetical protein
MLLNKLIQENPEINITVKAADLLQFGESIANTALKAFLQKHDEKVYSRQQVIDKFGICSATLWRWTRLGLIQSKKIGNRIFYPESEIKRLTNLKGGEK